MNIHFDKKTNIVRWTAPAGAVAYEIRMLHGTGAAGWGYTESTTETSLDLSLSPYWGNIKETGMSLEVVAYDNAAPPTVVDNDNINITITIPKPPWHQGSAVKLFMVLAAILGIWAGYSQYKLGKANDVGQQLSLAETMVSDNLTVISNLTRKLTIATNQPVIALYETNVVTVPVYERIKVYDIPQGMPKAGPAEKGSLVNLFSPTNQHTATRFVTSGNGVEFTTPNDWTVNCLVYANEADFDRLVNIGGLTNPHWVYYGPGIQLPSNTKVVAYWIRNRVPNSQLKVEFVLTPVAPVP